MRHGFDSRYPLQTQKVVTIPVRVMTKSEYSKEKTGLSSKTKIGILTSFFIRLSPTLIQILNLLQMNMPVFEHYLSIQAC